MKKTLLLILFFVCTALCSAVQARVGMFIGYDRVADIVDDDERAAAQWFQNHYSDGIIFTPANISDINPKEVTALWITIDRVGIAHGWDKLPAPFCSTAALAVLRDYLKQGGNLFLSNQATQLLVPLGRIDAAYAPGIFGSGEGGENSDNWGVNGWLGMAMSPSYDRRGHQVFSGLSVDVINGHEFFPFIGAGRKEDHNCMWDFNAIAGLQDIPNKLADFELKTGSVVLGTWQHVVDCACAGLIEFLPTAEFKGRVIANGIAAYEWNQNNGTNVFQNNIERFTANTLEYLQSAPTGLGAALPLEKVASLDMSIFKKRGYFYVKDVAAQQNVFLSQITTPANLPGPKGDALRFDGYSTTLVPKVDLASKNRNSFTFSMWVAPEAYPAMNIDRDENRFTTMAGNLNHEEKAGWAFELSNRGNYRFSCYTGGYLTVIDGNGMLPRYEWSHLVSTVDADNCKVTFYRNGQVLGAAVCLPTFNAGAAAVNIGRSSEKVKEYGYDLNVFDGLIDDIDVYAGVLPYEDIKETTDLVPDMNYPASHYAEDIYRPAFHGMPTANWTNETNGAIYYNGKFHVFFQKCPTGNYLAHMHIGHIYSDDLINWREDRTAFAPTSWYDLKGCWSGSVFQNPDFNDGKPTFVYTGVNFERACIATGSSLDDNLTNWVKQGPVIDHRPDGLSDDFRDPYFFSHHGNNYLIVGGRKGDAGVATLHRFDKNSRTWSNDGTLFFEGAVGQLNGVYWEMPNVTPFGDKWLFTTTPMQSTRGVRTIYWLGDIADDGKFVPTSGTVEEPQTIELSGVAKDGYGLLSPSIFKYNDKTLLLGIVPDKGGIDNYMQGWAHTYSLPREICLSSDGKRIEQRPYSGLEAMRTATKFSQTNFDLDGSLSLAPVAGRKVEIFGSFKVGKDEFGLKFFGDGEKAAKLYFTPKYNAVTLDISEIDRLVNDDSSFGGKYNSQLPEKINEGDVVTLHIYIDNSIADIFINDKWAFSVRIYATNTAADKVEAYALGSTHVNSMSAWVLDPQSDGISTGIDHAMVSCNKDAEAPAYNMAGQRVSNSFRGFVIQGGKKYFKK